LLFPWRFLTNTVNAQLSLMEKESCFEDETHDASRLEKSDQDSQEYVAHKAKEHAEHSTKTEQNAAVDQNSEKSEQDAAVNQNSEESEQESDGGTDSLDVRPTGIE
jgi:hypothetical protein